ncbi:MAG: hypothetical protein ABRQ37_26645, partial [Candidatus Eremiobacterota bacterium]
MGLDDSSEINMDIFKNFIKELLAGNKDSLLCIKEEERVNRLKEVLNLIFTSANISGTTFSLLDLEVDDKQIDLLVKGEKTDEYKAIFNDNNTLFMVYPADATKKGADKILQMCNQRGKITRITDPTQEPEPEIKGCYIKGLSPGEYYYSNYGSMKTLVDKKLSTADAGELARHLIEAAYDYQITEEDCNSTDCNSTEGITIEVYKKEQVIERRYNIAGNIVKEENITDNQDIKVRSPITCKSKKGICQKCYGTDLSTGKLVEIGTPVGLLAAQSIGERGTQIQMKGAKGDVLETEHVKDLFYNPEKKLKNKKDKKGKKNKKTAKEYKDIDEILKILLPKARDTYEGAINDIHFEVIYKSLISKTDDKWEITGIKDLIKSGDILKSASFGNPLERLSDIATGKKEITIDGLKKKLLFLKYEGGL